MFAPVTEHEFEKLIGQMRDWLVDRYRATHADDETLLRELMQHITADLGLPQVLAFRVREEIAKDLRGYSVVTDLIEDPEVSDVIIHRPDDITYEKAGVKGNWPLHFRSNEHLMLFISNLAFRGRFRIDVSNPMGSFTTPEGFRVAVAIPPVSLYPTVAIRKFTDVPTVDDLIRRGYFTPEAGEFVKAIVRGRRNLLVIGGMGTGKTTMLAILAKLFDEKEQPLLIEEVMEAPINVPHLRRLVARPPSIDGRGEVTLGMLLKTALQMKPTRVIVSEVRDGAIFYMFQAMLIGHEGSMSTLHANSAEDALFKRIPSMLAMSPEASLLSYEQRVELAASAVHFIMHLEQDPYTGERYMKALSEVVEDPEPAVRPIFLREDGRLRATGAVPERAARDMARYGVAVDPAWFRN